MRKIFLIIFLLVSSTAYANQRAITDTGDEVILNSDGTWKYLNVIEKERSIEKNKKKFSKSPEATFLLKSKNNDSAYWLNTKKWDFKKSQTNKEAEYEFKLKGKDLYGLCITEAIRIPLENLADIALENTRSIVPNMQVLHKEYRNVNGLEVIYLKMQGTMQGIEITYFGYFHSNDSGTTQLFAYTGTNLVPQFEDEINNFLNGFTIQ